MSISQKTVLRIVASGQPSHPEAAGSSAAGEESEAEHGRDAAGGLLFGLLLLSLNDITSAEEVLSEVYDDLRMNYARLEKSGEDLLTWLITVTHRHALERLCSSSEDQGFKASVGLARAPSVREPRSFGISKSAHRRWVAASLDDLSPVERQMIGLAYFSRMSVWEIALKLRQSPDAVSAGLQHGISQLYNLFKNWEYFVGRRIAPQVSGNTR